MKKILVDCDLTFGVPQHPMDDGLAILYLLGEPDVEIVGITCTFGNADIGTTFEATKKMMRDIGRSDIPVFGGAMPTGLDYRRSGQRYEVAEIEAPDGEGNRSRISDAALFMAEEARRLDGELLILALGAQTNLAGAWESDHDFFDHLRGARPVRRPCRDHYVFHATVASDDHRAERAGSLRRPAVRRRHGTHRDPGDSEHRGCDEQ